jgi:hypothetical protein
MLPRPTLGGSFNMPSKNAGAKSSSNGKLSSGATCLNGDAKLRPRESDGLRRQTPTLPSNDLRYPVCDGERRFV